MSDYVFLSADYDQVEFRVLAHESQDPRMLEIFRNGEDTHTQTAAEMFRIPVDQVDSVKHRLPAKNTGFGIVYGIQGPGLFNQFEQNAPGMWSLEQCYAFIATYLSIRPGVKAYMERAMAEGRRYGYVSDLFGRRRYVPEIHSSRKSTRAEGERYAINAKIQMGAQSIIRLAMGAVWEWLEGERLVGVVRPLLQVHDELLFEVREDLVEMVKRVLPRLMTGVCELSVPLKVSMKTGRRLGEVEG